MSNLSADLIAQLRCPETRQPLTLADEACLARVRESTGNTTECDEALIREDGRRAYLIRDGFPILLISEAVELESMGS